MNLIEQQVAEQVSLKLQLKSNPGISMFYKSKSMEFIETKTWNCSICLQSMESLGLGLKLQYFCNYFFPTISCT